MILRCIQYIIKENQLLLKESSISENMYVYKLYDIVKEYNNTYHKTIKMKPIDVKVIRILILRKKLIMETQNLKLVIM